MDKIRGSETKYRAQENRVYCGKSVYSDMLSPVGVYRVFQALQRQQRVSGTSAGVECVFS